MQCKIENVKIIFSLYLKKFRWLSLSLSKYFRFARNTNSQWWVKLDLSYFLQYFELSDIFPKNATVCIFDRSSFLTDHVGKSGRQFWQSFIFYFCIVISLYFGNQSLFLHRTSFCAVIAGHHPYHRYQYLFIKLSRFNSKYKIQNCGIPTPPLLSISVHQTQ